MYDGSISSLVGAVLYVVAPVLLVVVLLLLLRAVIAGGIRDGLRAARTGEDPDTILKRRYALGEIDESEFQRCQRLLSTPQHPSSDNSSPGEHPSALDP